MFERYDGTRGQGMNGSELFKLSTAKMGYLREDRRSSLACYPPTDRKGVKQTGTKGLREVWALLWGHRAGRG